MSWDFFGIWTLDSGLSMVMVWVESHRQLVNADVDDDQRHSTLLLCLLLGRLLEELDSGERSLGRMDWS